ncbi:hypothetical protein KY308_03080, partial [Candidatus Woesearchaeota archaeon]|nr:hypothetical protein [Candidatus Woesearchaeota archaeon]
MIKLAVTQKLEDLGTKLDRDDFVVILNLPDANLCSKRTEKVMGPDGTLEQACKGCITQDFKFRNERLPLGNIKEIIDYFSKNYGTQIITINGRGDPFDNRLKSTTLEKIRYAAGKGIVSYIFTAGNNLDDKIIDILVNSDANVMISLFGNKFIDADFFAGKEYAHSKAPMQDQAQISCNLRKLISAYGRFGKLAKNGRKITNVGMNYVVSHTDLYDRGAKVKALKKAANDAGLFFICNNHFEKHPDASMQLRVEALASELTDRSDSTMVDGRCQMGAGSSVTVDYNGELYRCPYLNGGGQGKFQH